MTLRQKLKIVVVGDSKVGKTSLLQTYINGRPPDVYEPTVFENHDFMTKIGGKEISLELIDTTGEQEYAKLRPVAYESTHAVIICFDIVDPASFKNMKEKWIPELRNNLDSSRNIPVVVVGCKRDLREDPVTLRALSESELFPILKESGIQLTEEIEGYGYLETSSFSKSNIIDVFKTCVNAVSGKKKSLKNRSRNNSFSSNNGTRKRTNSFSLKNFRIRRKKSKVVDPDSELIETMERKKREEAQAKEKEEVEEERKRSEKKKLEKEIFSNNEEKKLQNERKRVGDEITRRETEIEDLEKLYASNLQRMFEDRNKNRKDRERRRLEVILRQHAEHLGKFEKQFQETKESIFRTKGLESLANEKQKLEAEVSRRKRDIIRMHKEEKMFKHTYLRKAHERLLLEQEITKRGSEAESYESSLLSAKVKLMKLREEEGLRNSKIQVQMETRRVEEQLEEFERLFRISKYQYFEREEETRRLKEQRSLSLVNERRFSEMKEHKRVLGEIQLRMEDTNDFENDIFGVQRRKYYAMLETRRMDHEQGIVDSEISRRQEDEERFSIHFAEKKMKYIRDCDVMRIELEKTRVDAIIRRNVEVEARWLMMSQKDEERKQQERRRIEDVIRNMNDEAQIHEKDLLRYKRKIFETNERIRMETEKRRLSMLLKKVEEGKTSFLKSRILVIKKKKEEEEEERRIRTQHEHEVEKLVWERKYLDGVVKSRMLEEERFNRSFRTMKKKYLMKLKEERIKRNRKKIVRREREIAELLNSIVIKEKMKASRVEQLYYKKKKKEVKKVKKKKKKVLIKHKKDQARKPKEDQWGNSNNNIKGRRNSGISEDELKLRLQGVILASDRSSSVTNKSCQTKTRKSKPFDNIHNNNNNNNKKKSLQASTSGRRYKSPYSRIRILSVLNTNSISDLERGGHRKTQL